MTHLNYDVLTTAGVGGRTMACFSVPWVTDEATFAKVRILHEEAGVLVNRTILAPRWLARLRRFPLVWRWFLAHDIFARLLDRGIPDFASRRVCARVSSLGGFAVGPCVRGLEELTGWAEKRQEG